MSSSNTDCSAWLMQAVAVILSSSQVVAAEEPPLEENQCAWKLQVRRHLGETGLFRNLCTRHCIVDDRHQPTEDALVHWWSSYLSSKDLLIIFVEDGHQNMRESRKIFANVSKTRFSDVKIDFENLDFAATYF